MGRTFDRHEIINTPEAKGMRCAPSARGRLVNASKLIARRRVGLKQTHSIGTGYLENPGAYRRQKLMALTSPEAARALQLLQVDQHRFDRSETVQGLRLQADFAGLDDTEFAPPDCQMAAGPDHLVVTVNASWAVFDKTGRQLLRRNFADMFENLAENPTIFKPRVVYDQSRGGWLLAACGISADQQQSWFFLAASHGPDPLGEWWIWALDAGIDGSQRTGLRPDALGLAVDASSVYLTANMFNAQGQFVYAKLRLLFKKDMQTGGILHGWDFWQLRNFDGTPAFGLQPAVNLRSPDAQYLLNATGDGQGLTQWKVTQLTRQAPALSRKFIATVPYQLAPNARQQKIEREIETGDTRLCQVVYRHGMLWTAHSIAVNWGENLNYSAIQWFQINPKAGCVTQQGIFGAPSYHYFCPAVVVDGEGNMVMVFNRVSEADPPSICYTGRFPSDEQNVLHESAELQQSSMAGASEWSLCSASATAPEEDAVWIMGQYVATESDWATWVGAVGRAREGRPATVSPSTGQTVYA